MKQLVSQLPWGRVIRLSQRVKDPDTRQWYIKASIEHGWSCNILELQIDAHERHGEAITDFNATLPLLLNLRRAWMQSNSTPWRKD